MDLDLKAAQGEFNKLHDAADAYKQSVDTACKDEERVWTDEETAKFTGMVDEAKAAQKKVEDIESALKRGAALTGLTEFKNRKTPRLADLDTPGGTPPLGAQPATVDGAIFAPQKVTRIFGSDRAAVGFHRFVMATDMMNENRIEHRQWCEQNGIQIQAAMGIGNQPKGAAMVPEQYYPTLIRLVEDAGLFRRMARVLPMASDSMVIPRRTSGLTSYWMAENTAITNTDLGLDNVQLVAQDHSTLTYVSNALMQDANPSIGDLLATECALAIAVGEDKAGFIGDGTSTYGGAHGWTKKLIDGNHDGSVLTLGSSDLNYGDVVLTDFHNLRAKLPEFPGIRPAWYIKKIGYFSCMEKLAIAAGGTSATEVVNGVTRYLFLGDPVYYAQQMTDFTSDVASTAMVLYGDFSMGCTLGDRQTMAFGTDSAGVHFTKNQTCVKMTERVAINVHECGDGSNAGPVVVMKSAAS